MAKRSYRTINTQKFIAKFGKHIFDGFSASDYIRWERDERSTTERVPTIGGMNNVFKNNSPALVERVTLSFSMVVGNVNDDGIISFFDKLSNGIQGYKGIFTVMYQGELLYNATAVVLSSSTFTSVGVDGVGDIELVLDCSDITKKNFPMYDLIDVDTL
jgi:hypothetical protein